MANSPATEQLGLDSDAYDRLWRDIPDFIRYNPGARHRRRITLDLIRPLIFKNVLDVGCGNAEFLQLLRAELRREASFEGSDISPEVIERNRAAVPSMSFHVFDINKDPLPNAEYDLVVCSEVIEHLHDQRLAIRNLAAGVAAGGHLLITTPTGRMYATEKHFGHTNHLTPAQVRDYAGACGMEVARLINWGWPFYKMLKWATNVRSDWALKNFASGRYSFPAKAVSTGLFYTNYFNLNTPMGCQLFVLLRNQ